MNILQVKNLTFSYGKRKILNNVSFDVKDGLIGILGPNGAGKTTLIKQLTTLYPIQSGEIMLNNIKYSKDIKYIRANLGYLPQDFQTHGNLTGREFLEIIASIKYSWDKNKIKNEINNIISTLKLNDYIDQRINEYSGGMKQKLGFSQVLIGNPKLIIIDEPTVGLDPEQRNSIRELFPLLSKDRIVITTTHIIEDIENYCNSLILLDKGKIIYNGSKFDFLQSIHGQIWETDANDDEYELLSNKNCIISTFNSTQVLKLRYISKNPLTVNSINVEPNLQDAYIAYRKDVL